MLDWSLKFRFFDLSKITVFVLDEADVMIATQVGSVALESEDHQTLSLSFRDIKTRASGFTRTWDHIARCCYSQLLMTRLPSCTMHKISWDHSIMQAVMDFAENIVSNPVTIKLRREEESLDNIKQVSLHVISVIHS